MEIEVDFEQVGSNLKNRAAYDEWKRIIEKLPNAILTEGMEKAFKKGAQYLASTLRQIIPVSIETRTKDGKHLRDTVRISKGRPQWFPSYLVKVGGTRRARHYHLLEFGFTKKGGKGIVPPTLIINNATQNALPQIDQSVAAEVRANEKQIVEDANRI